MLKKKQHIYYYLHHPKKTQELVKYVREDLYIIVKLTRIKIKYSHSVVILILQINTEYNLFCAAISIQKVIIPNKQINK